MRIYTSKPITNCEHTTKKHYANGYCKACYLKLRYSLKDKTIVVRNIKSYLDNYDVLYDLIYNRKLLVSAICKLYDNIISDKAIYELIDKYNLRELYITIKNDKLYNSKEWLYEKYIVENLTIKQIAKFCNVDDAIIHKKLHQFNINRLDKYSDVEDYRNKDWLYQKVVVENISYTTIAKTCNTSTTQILTYIKKYQLI